MDQSSVPYTVLNEAISDDGEIVLYIQRYAYPQRVYQVLRAEWDEETEGEFVPNPAYADKYWGGRALLLGTYDDDDQLAEVFALVLRDEENQPVDDSAEIASPTDPCFLVGYDPGDELYKCEPTGCYCDEVKRVNKEYEAVLERVAASTLRAVIDQGIAVLDQLIENSTR